MTRPKNDQLYTLTEEERKWLEFISRSANESVAHVAHARELLAFADGSRDIEAAKRNAKKSVDSMFQRIEQSFPETVASLKYISLR